MCDFLFPAPNIPDISRCVLFQHNVESVIWERQAQQAQNPAGRMYFGMQARRMRKVEGAASRRAGHVIAVSPIDEARMRELYGVARVSVIPTGVDLEYFAPPELAEAKAELVFVGRFHGLDAEYRRRKFFSGGSAFPRIVEKRPHITFAIVGRSPSERLRTQTESDSRITVTGTVPDVRPWLWGAKLSVVPLRIGGGTRLKIYEAMAARIPVDSTAIGAEGLQI